MAQGIREAIAGQQKEFTLEFDCHSPTKKRWFLCHITRFPGPGPVRVVVAHENITQMKLLQQQRFRNQRLESIDTLAGGMAHDLNNALAPILMGLEMLKDKYPDDSNIADIFFTSAKRGADMVCHHHRRPHATNGWDRLCPHAPADAARHPGGGGQRVLGEQGG